MDCRDLMKDPDYTEGVTVQDLHNNRELKRQLERQAVNAEAEADRILELQKERKTCQHVNKVAKKRVKEDTEKKKSAKEDKKKEK